VDPVPDPLFRKYGIEPIPLDLATDIATNNCPRASEMLHPVKSTKIEKGTKKK
jgi:hypothetical protein